MCSPGSDVLEGNAGVQRHVEERRVGHHVPHRPPNAADEAGDDLDPDAARGSDRPESVAAVTSR